MTTITLADDFEHGINIAGGFYSQVTGAGTFTVTTDAARSGSLGGKFVTSAGSNIYAARTIPASENHRQLVVSAYIRFPTVQSQYEVLLEVRMTAAITRYARLGIDASNQFFVNYYDAGDVNTQTRIGAISSNTWYRADLLFDTSGTTWTVDWQIDGSAQTQATYGSMVATNIDRFTYGLNNGSTTEVHYDDIRASYVTGDYPLGPASLPRYAPVTPVLDYFNRADEDPVSDSGNWAGPIKTGDTQLRVVSNQLAPASTGVGGSTNYWAVQQFAVPLEVYMTLATASFNAGVDYCVNDVNSTVFDLYRLQVGAGSVNKCSHYICINGSFSQLGSNFPIAFASGDSLAATFDGNVHTHYYKPAAGSWTLMGSISNTQLLSGYIAAFLTVNNQTLRGESFGGGRAITPSSFNSPNLVHLGRTSGG